MVRRYFLKIVPRYFIVLVSVVWQILLPDDGQSMPIAVHQRQRSCAMIVFVHGTILPVPCVDSFKAFFNNKKSETHSWYNHYIGMLKHHSFYVQPAGTKIFERILVPRDSAGASRAEKLVSIYEKAFTSHASFKDKELAFFMLNWDAHLHIDCRRQAGYLLYHELLQELKVLQEVYGKDNVSLIILAHSHGGNVALYLGEAEISFKKKLVVDQLVLLGTPIQVETECLVQSPVFRSVYNIYSKSDWVQVIDVISTRGMLSGKLFETSRQLPVLPASLKQIQVRVHALSPWHGELWLFGGDASYWLSRMCIYRKDFPLYPFPVALFAPEIIAHAQQSRLNASPLAYNLVISEQKKNELVEHYKRLFGQ